jgi:hypothetical protein
MDRYNVCFAISHRAINEQLALSMTAYQTMCQDVLAHSQAPQYSS